MAGVLVAIDWENIRRGLADFAQSVTLIQVCTAFESVAARFGDYRGGTVFGDWTLRPDDARVFEDHGLQAYNVLRSRSGKDRSDPAIILEVYDSVRDKPDINTFILGSGDSDFKELIRRAKQKGKQVVICALGVTIANELKTMTPIFPLEAELGLTPKAIVTLSLPGIALTPTLGKWKAFVTRLHEMERTHPYIVLNYLRRLLSQAWGAGDTEAERAAFIQEALSQDIVITYELDNPQLPGRTVTALRLNRDNDLVKQILP